MLGGGGGGGRKFVDSMSTYIYIYSLVDYIYIL